MIDIHESIDYVVLRWLWGGGAAVIVVVDDDDD